MRIESDQNENIKVVMFTYPFPPYNAIGSIRNLNIAKQFEKYFRDVSVLTTTNVEKIEESDNSSLRIKRLFTFDYDYIRRKLRKKNKLKTQAKEVKSSFFNVFVTKLINSFPFSLFIGIGGIFYILNGLFFSFINYRNGRLLLYSSFTPYADHILAYFVKKINKEAYWIADYRDVFIMPGESNFFFPKIETYLHSRVFKKADLVTVVSEGHKEHFKKFGIEPFVLRNSCNLKIRKDTKEQRQEKFKITYTGKLYKDKRDPTLMFIAIENLIEVGVIDKNLIEVIYAGTESSYWIDKSLKYSFITTDLGLLKREEVLELQNEAHILLMMNWNTPELLGGLSGKLFEYLEANKSIIALIKGQQDPEIEHMFNELNAGLVVYDNIEEVELLQQFIKTIYLRWANAEDYIKPINLDKLKYFTWDYTFENLLDNIKNDIEN